MQLSEIAIYAAQEATLQASSLKTQLRHLSMTKQAQWKITFLLLRLQLLKKKVYVTMMVHLGAKDKDRACNGTSVIQTTTKSYCSTSKTSQAILEKVIVDRKQKDIRLGKGESSFH